MEKPGKTLAQEREDQLAAALRANLRRRKAPPKPPAAPPPDESDKPS